MALEEAGRGTDLGAHILTSLGDVAADAWDACVPGQHPFVRHAFLSALEESGSATAETQVSDPLVVRKWSLEMACLFIVRPGVAGQDV